MLVGIDNLDIVRMEKFTQNQRNLGKIFTPYEAMYISKTNRSTQRMAGIFCAKEAFLKALGVGVRNGIDFSEIEVKHEPSGKPYLVVSDKVKILMFTKGVKEIQISIAHTDDICTAICVLS